MSADALVGAVLAGGRSSRMGADKASMIVDGVPMARRGIDALRGAGLERVVVVGGAVDFDVELIPDAVPGGGPLDALLSAFGATAPADLVVLPCDLPRINAEAVIALLDFSAEHPAADVVVGTVDRRRAWPVARWRRSSEAPVRDAFATGVRSFGGAVAALQVAEVELGAPIADADEPGDLPGTDTLAGGDHHDHGGAW